MSPSRPFLLLLALGLLIFPVRAAESIPVTLAPSDAALQGICIRQVPPASQGLLRLDRRILRPGDVLPARDLERLCFAPSPGGCGPVQLSYLPLTAGGIEPMAHWSFSLPRRKNEPPIAQDSAGETYQDLPCEGMLRVTEPEGEAMTFSLVRPPKRGTVRLEADGSFLYTPLPRKVGLDSFTYCATDAAGNTSREAAVTIRILKASADKPYADTAGRPCRFAAEWLREAGIFTGETIGDSCCFSPDVPVGRGEFLAMLMQTLRLPAAPSPQTEALYDRAPLWMQPYLTAALGCGILKPQLPDSDPSMAQPIFPGEALSMVEQGLSVSLPASLQSGPEIEDWAEEAMTAALRPDRPDALPLTRSDAALILLRLREIQGNRRLLSPIFSRFSRTGRGF